MTFLKREIKTNQAGEEDWIEPWWGRPAYQINLVRPMRAVPITPKITWHQILLLDEVEMCKILSEKQSSKMFFLSTRRCWRFYKLGACGKPKMLLFSVSSWISSFQPVLSWLFLPSFLSFSSFPFLLFLLLSSKIIKVRVIDDEEYEKNKTFYIEIGEPRLMESNDTKGQEGGEPWWPPSPQRVRHHVRRRCMFSTHEGDSESFFTSWCVFSLTENMRQVVDHLIPPHPPCHLIYMCVCVCWVFFFMCVCAHTLPWFLFTMHAFTTSLYVYVCVRVCPIQEEHNH